MKRILCLVCAWSICCLLVHETMAGVIHSGTYTYSVAPSAAISGYSGDVGNAGPIAFTSSSILGDGIQGASSTVCWNNGSNALGSGGVTITFDLEAEYNIGEVNVNCGLANSYWCVGAVYFRYSTDGVTYTELGSDGSREYGPGVLTRSYSYGGVSARYVQVQACSNHWYHLGVSDVEIRDTAPEAPVFSPAGPEISGPTLVTITCATDGATIYYTTDGTHPATSPTRGSFLNSGTVTVNPGTTLKAIAVKAGHGNSDLASVTYIAPVTKIDTKTWTFSRVQVADGGSVFWTSPSAISPQGTSYDYTYTITKIELSMTTLSWTDMTNFFDAGILSGSGSVNGSVPFDVINQTMSGTSGGFGATATVHAYVDASGYLHVDITNVSLDLLTYNYARVSGTVTANAYARVYSASPVLVALPGSVDVPADAGSTSFTVNNAGGGVMGWSAQVIDGAGWVSITNGSSGSNDGTISVSYAKNISPVAIRTATIRITASGATGSPKDVMIIQAVAALVPGDANRDGVVNVGDLGILAANYSRDLQTQGVEAAEWWGLGDFNTDGVVNVGDLGILAANYGTNTSGVSDFAGDCAKVFDSAAENEEEEDLDAGVCGALGLPLMAGLVLMGLMLVKFEE